MADDIRTAALHGAATGDWQIALRLVAGDSADGLRPEGFRIEKTNRDAAGRIEILAIDPAGLLYGGLEVAAFIRVHSSSTR